MNIHSKQQGAALITALVCLTLISLMGVIAVRTSTTNSKIASNAKQIAQATRLASSGVASLFINPAAVWTLQTRAGANNPLGFVQLGNAQVPLQAEYKTDAVCSIRKGVRIDAGENSTGSVCIHFRAASNYQTNPQIGAVSAAGFFSEVEQR